MFDRAARSEDRLPQVPPGDYCLPPASRGIAGSGRYRPTSMCAQPHRGSTYSGPNNFRADLIHCLAGRRYEIVTIQRLVDRVLQLREEHRILARAQSRQMILVRDGQ